MKSIIGDRIKQLREVKGISQSELAEVLNVGRETVARWENGTRDIKANSIIDLSNYFGVTSDFVLGLSKNQTYNNACVGEGLGLSDTAIEQIKNMPSGLFSEKEVLDLMFQMGDIKQTLNYIAIMAANYFSEENIKESLLSEYMAVKSFSSVIEKLKHFYKDTYDLIYKESDETKELMLQKANDLYLYVYQYDKTPLQDKLNCRGFVLGATPNPKKRRDNNGND